MEKTRDNWKTRDNASGLESSDAIGIKTRKTVFAEFLQSKKDSCQGLHQIFFIFLAKRNIVII